MSSSDWTFSQEFSAQFQSSRSDLEYRVNAAKSTPPVSPELLKAFSADLAKLAKSLVDATGSLPSYDQRQCELQLKYLETMLEELRTSLPKSKFVFKRKAVTTPSTTASNIPTTTVEVKPSLSDGSSAPTASTNLTFSSRTNCYLTLESLPASILSSDLTISDLDNCIVNLVPNQSENCEKGLLPKHGGYLGISALHIRNLTNCVLLLNVNGSVLLHGLSRCVIVVGCHQFRMHDSSNVDVYLSIPSNPIIERCSHVRFSHYPDVLSAQPSDEMPKSHLAIQDFSHIRSTPSPHWSVMVESSRVKDWPMSPTKSRQELDEALERVLPQASDVIFP